MVWRWRRALGVAVAPRSWCGGGAALLLWRLLLIAGEHFVEIRARVLGFLRQLHQLRKGIVIIKRVECLAIIRHRILYTRARCERRRNNTVDHHNNSGDHHNNERPAGLSRRWIWCPSPSKRGGGSSRLCRRSMRPQSSAHSLARNPQVQASCSDPAKHARLDRIYESAEIAPRYAAEIAVEIVPARRTGTQSIP